MKNIVVLIDFTEGSKVALVQAAALAKQTNAKLYGLHIVSSQHKEEEASRQLTQFLEDNVPGNISKEAVIGMGALNVAIHDELRKIRPDLVVICTHGIKGVVQHLFGAQILKLVQALPYPCIVIHEKWKIDLANTKQILFPLGPHPEFMTKIKQVTLFAKALDASLVIYEIDRPSGEYDVVLAKNLEQAIAYFEEAGVRYEKVLEEPKVISVGFSRQTLDYASAHNIPVIAIMATVSNNEIIFGLGDKENFLVNEQGISIMTCNM